jgi:predicted SnoaL-like aldol condensation-catalyzing enzyme
MPVASGRTKGLLTATICVANGHFEASFVTQTPEGTNKTTVPKAFYTLFNKRDSAAADQLWSPNCIQHSAHIGPGREGSLGLVKKAPPTTKYESNLSFADNDKVMLHGRFSGHGSPRSWIAADIVGMENGLLSEHWDALQDETSEEESQCGLPMFGNRFLDAAADRKSVSSLGLRPASVQDRFFGEGPTLTLLLRAPWY